MSNFKVSVTTILGVKDHPNADRLSIYTVYGFEVIGQKNKYQVGDKVIYCPVDALLPQWLEDTLFPPDSKIKLNKHRIRQIRIRGLASQGMLIPPEAVSTKVSRIVEVEEDLAGEIGITKYEPPERSNGVVSRPGGRKVKADENPFFHKYNGLDNIKWYPDKFKPEEEIVLQEKVHGTNARAAMMPFVANTLWKKIKKFLGLAPAYEFCYGSNNVQLQNKSGHKGFYGEDVYGKCFEKYDVKSKIKPGETIYGEIYGDGIQKNYHYGCARGEHKFALFDVKVLQEDGSQKWLSPDEVNAYAKERGFDVTPEIYRGPYISLEFVKQHAEGDSVLAPSQKIREGVVVKSVKEYDEFGNKRALKVISEAYLDDPSNTDFH